jgi:hypothetical protein
MEILDSPNEGTSLFRHGQTPSFSFAFPKTDFFKLGFPSPLFPTLANQQLAVEKLPNQSCSVFFYFSGQKHENKPI